MPDAIETVFQSALAFGKHGGVSTYIIMFLICSSFGPFGSSVALFNLYNKYKKPFLLWYHDSISRLISWCNVTMGIGWGADGWSGICSCLVFKSCTITGFPSRGSTITHSKPAIFSNKFGPIPVAELHWYSQWQERLFELPTIGSFKVRESTKPSMKKEANFYLFCSAMNTVSCKIISLYSVTLFFEW